MNLPDDSSGPLPPNHDSNTPGSGFSPPMNLWKKLIAKGALMKKASETPATSDLQITAGGLKPAEVYQKAKMRKYYAFQAKIYDRTRWSFLFGRRSITGAIPFGKEEELTILEVGCGTGYNLNRLAKRFPNSQLIGIDVSADMLEKAFKKTRGKRDRIQLIEGAYGETPLPQQPDIILFSYCLTMVNPHWINLVRQAKQDLQAGGCLAFVDFHHSKRSWFRRHMKNHHVRMDGHILPFLRQHFYPVFEELETAYFGTWQYVQFIGKKVGD